MSQELPLGGKIVFPGREFLHSMFSNKIAVHLHHDHFTLGNSKAILYEVDPATAEDLKHGNVPSEWKTIEGMPTDYAFFDHRESEETWVLGRVRQALVEKEASAAGPSGGSSARPSDDDLEPRALGMCNACFEIFPSMSLQARRYVAYVCAMAMFMFAWFFMVAAVLIDPIAWYYWLPGVWSTICFMGMNVARMAGRQGGVVNVGRREHFGLWDLVFTLSAALGFLWFCPPLLILIYEHGRGEPPHPALTFILFVQPIIIYASGILLAAARHIQPPRRRAAALVSAASETVV